VEIYRISITKKVKRINVYYLKATAKYSHIQENNVQNWYFLTIIMKIKIFFEIIYLITIFLQINGGCFKV